MTTFSDEDGNEMQPWAVRAGMLIVATEYSATHGLETVVLRPDGRSEDARAEFEREFKRPHSAP